MSEKDTGILSVVPTGKQVAWIVTIVGTSFISGGTAAATLGMYTGLPDSVAKVDSIAQENVHRLDGLQEQVDDMYQEVIGSLDEIGDEVRLTRCLARLSATGQVVDPLAIPDLCP